MPRKMRKKGQFQKLIDERVRKIRKGPKGAVKTPRKRLRKSQRS